LRVGTVRDQRSKTESKKISVVLTKAPNEYKGMLAMETTNKGNKVTIDDLQKVMKAYYRSKYGLSNSTTNENQNDNKNDGAQHRQ
jgi:hypothetical protein